MAKQIVYSEQARRALERGLDHVANTVKLTLGPAGRNVVLEKEFGAPQIINDGVSIAKEKISHFLFFANSIDSDQELVLITSNFVSNFFSIISKYSELIPM